MISQVLYSDVIKLFLLINSLVSKILLTLDLYFFVHKMIKKGLVIELPIFYIPNSSTKIWHKEVTQGHFFK